VQCQACHLADDPALLSLGNSRYNRQHLPSHTIAEVITMRPSQRGPFLDRLTHDVRLAIYAYVVLPPFSGCRDYRGLSLSCRQLCDEIDQEGTRQLRIFLQDISRTGIVKFAGDGLLQSNAQSSIQVDHCLHLQFEEPTSVLGPVVVFVKVPLTLPPPEHDWYLQSPLRTLRTDREGNSQHTFHRPPTEMLRSEISGSQNATRRNQGRICPRQHATPHTLPHVWHLPITVRRHPGSHIGQQSIYAVHIKELLTPIEALHQLHANIQIQLTADEETVARISQELLLYSNHDLKPGYKLDSTALGWLLEMYITHLKQRYLHNIGVRRREWAFHTRAMDIVWNLTSPCPVRPMSQVPQSSWRRRTKPNTSHDCHECQLLCTDDCREGMVRLKFDVEKAVRTKLTFAEERLREMESERQEGVEAYIERLEYDVFFQKEKLSVLGVAGYELAGSQEEREERLNDSWRERREVGDFCRRHGCYVIQS
jgi:hypothetical protein